MAPAALSPYLSRIEAIIAAKREKYSVSRWAMLA